MPNYKMYYINARGRAEIVRLAFAQAGVEYEDFRFERDDWPKYKSGAPFGTMPYIEIDGKKKVGQSMACARYIAREHGLMGKDSYEEAQVNAVCDAFTDILENMVKAHFAKCDEDKNAAMEKIPGLVTTAEEYLKGHNGGSGFFVGDNVTLADLRAFDIVSNLRNKKPEAAQMAPLLSAHCDRVAALPNIKAWLEKRPTTEM